MLLFVGTNTQYQVKMATSVYINDNDDYSVTPLEKSEEDIWIEEKKEIESLSRRLNAKHRKMAAHMVCYVYNELYSVAGFEVAPIYYDIPECRVTIRGVGSKRSLMYMVKLDPSNMYYISISPLHTLEEKSYYETPKELVDTLRNTQKDYLAN